MRILFVGGIKGNAGPVNVNRKLNKNFTSDFLCVKQGNKWVRLWDGFWKLTGCDAVVASGVSREACVFLGLAKILRKKTAYIMHGYAVYEYSVDVQNKSQRGLNQEAYLLKTADLLLPVSRKFMHWFRERRPEYACKMNYLSNGIDLDDIQGAGAVSKKSGTVIATGGDRKIKNNEVVAKAVEKMNGKVKLEVYGLIYHSAPEGYTHTAYLGVIPHDQYMQKMAETELFVLNSVFESFSISTIEALLCGCSVLVSEIAGVTDLLELKECDIIHDPMDADEIGRKMEYLLKNPNNERIVSKLDLEAYSYEKTVERLAKLCAELIQK